MFQAQPDRIRCDPCTHRNALISSKTSSSYDSWYASIGRSLTRSLYLEAFYNSSVVFFRMSGGNGILLENRPRTDRFGLSAIWNAWRTASLLVTAERVKDETYGEYRILSGVSYRF